jgi:CBS domain-containing protein
MSRGDDHLDAMLRHLGAAYYESLHGRAARSDVTRALDTVEEHLGEHAPKPGTQPPASSHPARPAGGPGHSRWARRVSDVMTTPVVTVDRLTPYQDVARLLAQHKISGVPVLRMGRHVAGVRPDADVVRDARQVVDELPLTDPEDVTVTVRHGVVTLTGTLEPASQRYRDLVAVALRLIWDVDGVVDVVSKLGQAVESKTA